MKMSCVSPPPPVVLYIFGISFEVLYLTGWIAGRDWFFPAVVPVSEFTHLLNAKMQGVSLELGGPLSWSCLECDFVRPSKGNRLHQLNEAISGFLASLLFLDFASPSPPLQGATCPLCACVGLVQRHIEAKHMGLVIRCHVCSQSFSRRDKYKTHMKNKHGLLQ